MFPRCSCSPSPRSAYSSNYEGSKDEDDSDLLSMTEDTGGVRDLAIADWHEPEFLTDIGAVLPTGGMVILDQ